MAQDFQRLSLSERLLWIGACPNVQVPVHAKAEQTSLPFPLNAHCHFFFSARYALYHGLAALGLKPGQRILTPAYCCGTELDPLLARGLCPVWYGIDRKLDIDVAELARQWTKDVKAILVVHYLGFDRLSESLQEFCQERQILIMEDCAHALLSKDRDGRPLGSRGDLAVFSLRKSLPVPDGGVLYLKDRWASGVPTNAAKPNPLSTFFRLCDLLAGSTSRSAGRLQLAGAATARLSGWLLGKGKRLCWSLSQRLGVGRTSTLDPNSYTFEPEALRWTMCSFTGRALAGQDWGHVAKQRRENFVCLLEGVKQLGIVQPVFDELPPGTSPLFLPVLVPDRDQLHAYLSARRVDTAKWWTYFHPAVPWSKFPIAAALKQELLGIPIHQGLGREHIEAILELLRRWSEKKVT